MAIYYCNIYGGNDANDGTSMANAKLTINAATALIGSISDEVRVRGFDNLSTDVGTMWWRNGSTSLTGSTDLTSVLSANTYIYKSTDTIPDIYKISSLSWNSGTSVMTITLVINVGYYEGTTEECGVMRVNLSGTNTVQSFNKAAYRTGTDNDYSARTGNTISGGWDEAGTSRTGYTLIYNTSGNLLTTQGYWWASYFMLIGTSGWGIPDFAQLNGHHIVIAGCTTSISIRAYTGLNDSVINCQGANADLFKASLSGCINVIVRGGYWIIKSGDFSGNYYMENCTFTNMNYYFPDGSVQCIFIGCRFILQQHFGNISNSMFSGCTYKTPSAGLFLSASATNNYMINNTYLAGSNTSLNMIPGVYVNNGITSFTNSIGSFLYNGFIQLTEPNMNFSSFTIPAVLAFYMTMYNREAYYNQTLLPYTDVAPINLKFKDKNVIWYNSALVETDTTGATSGTTSIKIKQTTSSEARAGTFDTIVNSGTTYNLSFYVKSSNSQNFSYNFMYCGDFMNASWTTGTTSSSSWTQYTTTLPAISGTGYGSIKLFIKFTSGTNHYLYLSNISVT